MSRIDSLAERILDHPVDVPHIIRHAEDATRRRMERSRRIEKHFAESGTESDELGLASVDALRDQTINFTYAIQMETRIELLHRLLLRRSGQPVRIREFPELLQCAQNEMESEQAHTVIWGCVRASVEDFVHEALVSFLSPDPERVYMDGAPVLSDSESELAEKIVDMVQERVYELLGLTK